MPHSIINRDSAVDVYLLSPIINGNRLGTLDRVKSEATRRRLFS